MYLLDSNILSCLVHEPHGRVEQRIRAAGNRRVVTSVIVAAELRFGAEKKQSARLARQVEAVLGGTPVLSLTEDMAGTYVQMRAELERRGTPIGANDLFIAAHALALDATLVTDNVREFSRVEGLSVENWLRD